MQISSPFTAGTIYKRYRTVILLSAFLAILIGTRATHLAGAIDEPHSWRQCDTAQYALSFYQDGINLMKPSVCWMGMHKTLIMEFPFPEMLMALAYKVLGYHLYLARLITLLFFAGSALYLFFIVRLMSHDRLAAIATGVYMVLPLSQFYSRAIHVDFFAVFFAHAMTFHLLRSFNRPRTLDSVLSIVMGVLGFLIKAPYVFYFALPLLCVVAQKKSLRSFMLLGSCFLISALSFVLWRQHADTVNAAVPDWVFIPGFIKFVNMEGWFYGPWHLRLEPNVWWKILGRFCHEVTSGVGVWLFLAGGIASIVAVIKGGWRQMLPLWAWFAGVLLYVIVFLKLNYFHNYYQIPLLGISSIFIALAIYAPFQILGCRLHKIAGALSLAMFITIFVASTKYARDAYYKQDITLQEAGRIIAKVTPADSLLIAVTNAGDCRDPRLLFWSRRIGWSVKRRDLSRELIERLRDQGATHVAIVARSADYIAQVYGIPATTYPMLGHEWKVIISELEHETLPNQTTADVARKSADPQR